MTQAVRYEIAKKYIDGQLARMKKHGSITKKISTRKYQNMIKQAARLVVEKNKA